MRLPIDPLLPEIAERLRTSSALVLEAPPGAGKTTRVPAALLNSIGQDVLVLEPRRLAARLAARYVASERGEAVGETVGYQVRFETAAGPNTRLRFLTEGVLTRRLLSDPELRSAGVVVLDEFHERHLEGDLALALLRRLQRTRRPDLRIVVMSATLDSGPVAQFLGAPVLRSEGRLHPLDIEYTPHSAAALEAQVAAALERVAADGLEGHALVFLPGAAEIRRTQAACAPLAARHGWLLAPLYGDQSPAEQDRAIALSTQPKVILSTNVAESSVTIEGVRVVIDSGLVRVAGHSPWSGLPTLSLSRISQSSANQRAGRAGRTGPGRVVRLYPREDFVRRPLHDVPEILREDLAPAALLLRAMGLEGLHSLEWLDPPPQASAAQAEDLLLRLGATGATADEMAGYPLHPRLGRLVVEARKRGVGEDGCAIAGLLSAGERLPADAPSAAGARSDLLLLLDSRWQPRTAEVVRQVRRAVNPPRQKGHNEDALLLSVLAAFPDRVARRRQGANLQLASGGQAQLAESSTVRSADFLVALEAEDRRDGRPPLVRIASAIEPEWLLDLFPDRVRESVRLEWNRSAERVESASTLLFEEIAIEESRGIPAPAEAAELLASKALESGPARFCDMEEVDGFFERVRFASAHGSVPQPEPVWIAAALRSLAEGLRSFAELEGAARHGGFLRALERQLPPGALRLVGELAPERVRLSGGRQVKVHYEAGQPPWIASRLQDFFGVKTTPAIAHGAVPLVIRLLAPNHRPVQTTTDLAGFWERLYPQVRKELSRRYPKHAWPERPN